MTDEPLALALKALSYKERSVAELAEWLSARGVTPEQIGAVVSELIELGTLDDARFARLYASDKREISGWGSDRIREALAERGIERPEIEAALAQGDQVSELQRAVALLGDRAMELDSEKGRSRALGLLARRGYDSDTAYEAIRVAEREAA